MIAEKYTYVFVDVLTLIFPLIFSFTEKFNFKDYWRFYFPGNIVVAITYILWDSLFTHLGVWGFDLKYTLGIAIGNLPVEELLFFICTPYACVFTYYCLRRYIYPKIQADFALLWIALGIIFFLISVYNFDRLYTASAFMSCSIGCIAAYYSKLISFVKFMLFYLLILIPFTIFNGLLTGSFLGRVVVFYNDMENLGIRILTIPVEDIFYGMALVLFNILFFEYFLRRTKVSV